MRRMGSSVLLAVLLASSVIMLAPLTLASADTAKPADSVGAASDGPAEKFDVTCSSFSNRFGQLEGDGIGTVKGEVGTLLCFYEVNDPPSKTHVDGKRVCTLRIDDDIYRNNTGYLKVYPDGHATLECKNLKLQDD